jgi:hypothetical protein
MAGRPAPATAGRPAPPARAAQGTTEAPPRRPTAGGADPRTVPRRARPGRAGAARAESTITEPLRRPARRPRLAPSRNGGGTQAGPAAATVAGAPGQVADRTAGGRTAVSRTPAGRVTGEAARRAAAARRLGGSRTPFVLLVLGLLGGGLVCLLVINTTLSAASYQINTLQQGNAQLSQQEQTLQQQIAKEQAPATIEQRAYQLGMRPEQRLNFVNARTGQISTQPAVLPGVPDVPGFTP